MRKIAANYIYPITSKPIKNGVIVMDDNGKIIDIIDNNGELKETSKLEFYNGILIPGFVNTHCHVELSHFKDKIQNPKNLCGFLEEIIKLKDDNPYNISLIKEGDNEMRKNGIVAVGDVSNDSVSNEIKQQSDIFYHTFIELSSLKPELTTQSMEKGLNLKKIFGKNSSIVPHSPYSATPELLRKISDIAKQENNIISIHNQETASENDLYKNKTGELYELTKKLKINMDWFKPSGTSSLQYILPFLPTKSNVLLVHNTQTSYEDMLFAEKYSKNIYWTMCPNSNLYIENKLPDINMFYKNNCKITLGTDSLSSNNKLDMLAEMQTIQNNFPDIPFQKILEWATINGAKALNIDNKYGSFEIGKTPGINLLKNFLSSESFSLSEVVNINSSFNF